MSHWSAYVQWQHENKKVTNEKIRLHLQEECHHSFSYGIIIQLCVPTALCAKEQAVLKEVSVSGHGNKRKSPKKI